MRNFPYLKLLCSIRNVINRLLLHNFSTLCSHSNLYQHAQLVSHTVIWMVYHLRNRQENHTNTHTCTHTHTINKQMVLDDRQQHVELLLHQMTLEMVVGLARHAYRKLAAPATLWNPVHLNGLTGQRSCRQITYLMLINLEVKSVRNYFELFEQILWWTICTQTLKLKGIGSFNQISLYFTLFCSGWFNATLVLYQCLNKCMVASIIARPSYLKFSMSWLSFMCSQLVTVDNWIRSSA